MLGPYHGALNKVEHPNESTQTELEEAMHRAETVVKKEECSDSVWIEVENAHDELVLADKEYLISDHKVKLETKLLGDDFCKAVKTEPVASISDEEDEKVDKTQYSLKIENTSFGCTLCFEEFTHEHEYHEHMSFHLQTAAADGSSQACENYTESSFQADSSDVMVHRHAAQKPDAVSLQSTYFAQTSAPSLTPGLSTRKVIKLLPIKAKAKSDSHKSRKRVLEFIIASMNNNCEAGREHKFPAADNMCNRPIQNETARLSNDIKATFNLLAGYSLRTHIVKECFICDFCHRKFTRKKLLVKHIKSHTDIKPLSYSFSQDECNLDRQHMRTHTIEKPYSCELCSYKSTRNNDLVRHMQTHTGEQPYSCKLCKYKFVRNSDLVRHMRTHTGERPYSCQVCKYKFVRNSDLVRHMRAHNGEKYYSCKSCDYKCVKHRNLVRHMRTHTGEKPYSCELCEYKCVKNSVLVRHMRAHTGEKPYSCKSCGYKCAQKSNLVSHMRTHTSEKPFSCKSCGYKCAQKSNLVSHMRSHTGEKPYYCKLCDYKCALNNDLVKHMRTHTGEKPYSCTLCAYNCANKNSLVLHMRTHTGVKPYPCKLCEYKSAYKHSLVLHMRTHTGEKPFSCKLCEYKCAQKSNLASHMRTQHG